MDIHIKDGDVTVDAELLGRLFDLAPVQIPQLMRTHAVKGICERGIDTHHGEFRLSFFFRNRRVRIHVGESGQILRRSIIDFGSRPLPRALHRPT
jgi:hypothetical protein